jgi:hypothetical protein
MRQRHSRSTAGVSSSARNRAIATGMKMSRAKYSTAPTPMMATSQTAFTSFGSGAESGCLEFACTSGMSVML